MLWSLALQVLGQKAPLTTVVFSMVIECTQSPVANNTRKSSPQATEGSDI